MNSFWTQWEEFQVKARNVKRQLKGKQLREFTKCWNAVEKYVAYLKETEKQAIEEVAALFGVKKKQ